MKLKYFALFLILSSTSFAQAAQRNICDDLIEDGTSSSEQVKRCQTKFGISDYAREQEAKTKIKNESAKKETDAEERKKDNLEFKKFTKDELFDAGFGKPFFAMRIDYRFRPAKEKRITEGDALCTYLGYEKSIKSIVSAEMLPEASDKQGLVVDTNIFGIVSKEPELYHDEDLKFTVRKYVEITCVKRKDKTISDSSDVYKKLTEDLLVLAPEINPPAKKDPNAGINNGPRSGKEVKTPNGYTPPEWAKEDPASNSSK